jgi:hypothetical protein
MDKTVPCFCTKKRLDPEEATLVLNGIPCCSQECLKRAEQALKRSKQKGWDCT